MGKLMVTDKAVHLTVEIVHSAEVSEVNETCFSG